MRVRAASFVSANRQPARRWLVGCGFLALLFASLDLRAGEDAGSASESRRRLGVFDLHTHIQADSIPKALEAMDRNGIRFAVQLTPGNTVDAFRAAKAEFDRLGQGRFFLYVNDVYSGFPIETPGYGEKVAAVVEECVRLGARGLKVSKSLGLFWKDKDGKLIAVDDSRLDAMWAACGRLDIPVSIHVADPTAFWLPVNEANERYDELKDHPNWSFHGGAYPSHAELLAQLDRVVARHPKVVFVGVHFGNHPEGIDAVAAMLRRRPNFRIDLAARLPEVGRHDPAKVRAFFAEFQDRIYFATDFMVSRSGYILGAGPRLGDEAEVDKFFQAHWRYLETEERQIEHPTPIQGRWKVNAVGLPREVLEKVYCRNALRLFKLERES
jgi:predicted TIM-barrel fold metal-dependent hydrolase